MSKNKSKLRWMYVTEPFNVYVDPKQVKRVHAPLEKSLTFEPEYQGYCLHLRPCVRGIDEYGATVKYLYCTRDGRFFVRKKDGWGEVKYDYNPAKQNYKKGSCHPCIRGFGNKSCHLCVAYAWLGSRPEGKVCDHLDTNLLNLNATNFEWVTVPENIRRAKIAKRMRKIGLDPKLLTPTLCKGIYSLPEERIEEFIGRFLMASNESVEPMDIWSIRTCVAIALDIIKSQISNDQ